MKWNKHGVSIIGYTDLPSRLATQSSQLYATNLRHLLTDMCPDKNGVIKIGGRLSGGHAYVINGVDTKTKMFRLKNSWGKSWGNSKKL